jgi:GRASP55/65 PDZ-like domain
MGNSASSQEAESVGYRVLGVQANSPASAAKLVSFFDFIVAANGECLKAKLQLCFRIHFAEALRCIAFEL